MKRGINLLLFLFGVLLISGLVSATNLNLGIEGTINYYNSKVYLKTNANAVSGLDIYDMKAPSAPENHSQFYSNIGEANLTIDVWDFDDPNKTRNLVYYMTNAQEGTLTLDWNSLTTQNWTATLYDYGTDATYTTLVSSENMSATTSYSVGISPATNRVYFQVEVEESIIIASDDEDSDDEEIVITPTTSSGGGGSGGLSSATFTVKPEIYEKTVLKESVTQGVLTITNEEKTKKEFEVSIEKIGDIVSFKETKFEIEGKESKKLEFKISAPNETGVYTGKVFVSSGNIKREIYFIINVETETSLFDITLKIPWNKQRLGIGENLLANLELTQIGLEEELEVLIKYTIIDFERNIYLYEEETRKILTYDDIKKEFDTSGLPMGTYILSVEVEHPNGIAVTSVYFRVEEKSIETLFVLFFVFVVSIFVAVSIANIIREEKFKSH